MTNSATQLRTAANTAQGLIFAALIFPLGIASVPALAGSNIQMLPPVTEATKLAASPTPCPPGGSPNILTWDGTNPISCSTGVTVSGGNVGIGTATPATVLELNSTALNDALRIGNGSGSPTWTFDIWRNSSTGALNFTGNQTGANNFVFNGGNVGIGTAAPQNALQVGSLGAINYNGNALALGDGTNAMAMKPGAVAFLTVSGDMVLGAGTNTTNQIYLQAGGNVGIGTANPQATLDVNGTVNASEYKIGYTRQSSGDSCAYDSDGSNWTDCTLTCISGQLISGGCALPVGAGGAYLINSYPASNTTWECRWGNGHVSNTSDVYIICGNVQ